MPLEHSLLGRMANSRIIGTDPGNATVPVALNFFRAHSRQPYLIAGWMPALPLQKSLPPVFSVVK
jgi:hypothetical protein